MNRHSRRGSSYKRYLDPNSLEDIPRTSRQRYDAEAALPHQCQPNNENDQDVHYHPDAQPMHGIAEEQPASPFDGHREDGDVEVPETAARQRRPSECHSDSFEDRNVQDFDYHPDAEPLNASEEEPVSPFDGVREDGDMELHDIDACQRRQSECHSDSFEDRDEQDFDYHPDAEPLNASEEEPVSPFDGVREDGDMELHDIDACQRRQSECHSDSFEDRDEQDFDYHPDAEPLNASEEEPVSPVHGFHEDSAMETLDSATDQSGSQSEPLEEGDSEREDLVDSMENLEMNEQRNYDIPNAADSSSSESDEDGSNHDAGPQEDEHNGNEAHFPQGREIQFQPQALPTSHNALREALRGTYSERIIDSAVVSRGEALLMAVKMNQQNGSSTKQLVDTIKLINALFGKSILPHSKYLLDKLLLSECGIQRHFFCEKCFCYFGDLDHRQVKTKECENCEFLNQLHDLTKAPHFVIYDIRFQLELLLTTIPFIFDNLKRPDEIVRDRPEGIYSDIYDGAQYRNFSESLGGIDADIIISLTFCADGSPLFSNFSTLSIWPLFLSINELPPLMRMKNLLIGGLWFGRKEPPMDLFLMPFTDYMRRLSTDGMLININDTNKSLMAFGLLCCVDSGARGQVQGLKTHAGYSSCNWCLHPGEWDGASVKYPNLNYVPAKRTHESIVDGANLVVGQGIASAGGVNAATPLINLGARFDLVNGMVVEYMHLVLLGLVRQFLKKWMKSTNAEYYIGDEETVVIINNKLENLKPPVEVRRFPRSISDHKHWNARDLENWLFYYSVPALTDVLPRKYLDHWMLLVHSMNLLSLRVITEGQLTLAEEYIIHFTVIAEQLYGLSFMTFNLHILKHLCSHVRRWGPIYAVSAFAFEAGNGTLKRLIHSQHGIPHQICRAISLKMAQQILESKCSTGVTQNFIEGISKQKALKCLTVDNVNYIGCSSTYRSTGDEEWLFNQAQIDTHHCVQFRKVIKDNCVYTCETNNVKRTNNSIAQLRNLKFMLVKKIIFHEVLLRGFILGHKVEYSMLRRLPQDPRNNDEARFLLNVNFTHEDIMLVPIEDLFTVCFYSHPIGNVLIPVPNLINVF